MHSFLAHLWYRLHYLDIDMSYPERPQSPRHVYNGKTMNFCTVSWLLYCYVFFALPTVRYEYHNIVEKNLNLAHYWYVQLISNLQEMALINLFGVKGKNIINKDIRSCHSISTGTFLVYFRKKNVWVNLKTHKRTLKRNYKLEDWVRPFKIVDCKLPYAELRNVFSNTLFTETKTI